MTIEKFYQTLSDIVRLESSIDIQKKLESILDALNNLVSSPAHPPHQNLLANALVSFSSAIQSLKEHLTPVDLDSIAELGGEEFFDTSMAAKVRESIEKNAMTPTVARDFVRDLETRRQVYLETIDRTMKGLKELGVTGATLRSGSADMAFLIPRDLFENHLGPFAKELNFINRLIADFSEAILENPEPVRVEGLSSSTPTISLLTDVQVIAGIATVVDKFLNAWERIRKLRKVREEVADLGLNDNLEEFTEKIQTTVDEVVEESVQITITNFKGDAGRRNELESLLRKDTKRLFSQIEKGLTIQFRAEPDDDEIHDDANKVALAAINEMSHKMQFPEPAKNPLLLSDGEDTEDESSEPITVGAKRVIRSTKTTTQTTTKGRKVKADSDGH